ncbi:MAG: hypothetical protein WBX25_06060 [Rhodomicrobium sp.]
MAQSKSIPIGWRLQLATGGILAVMALMAVRVDVVNNYTYGLTVNIELAMILVLAALCVVCLPTVAAILGWSRHLRWTTTICVLLTVWSAINAYSAKQGAAILAAETSRKAYETALLDEKAARETLAHISETGDAEELAKLQASIAITKATACKHPKAEDCKLAETNYRSITARLGDAKARDKAQATLAEAKHEAKAGNAEASMIATVIARQTGGDAASVARYIALALTGLGIAVTQLVALLGGHAANLIGSALRARPKQPAKAKKKKPLSNAERQRLHRAKKKAAQAAPRLKIVK